MFIVPISSIAPTALAKTEGAESGAVKSNVPFADILADSISQMKQAQEVSRQDAYDLAMGNADNLHTIAIHSAEASAALTMTVQLASRAVGAYKEIMQMQV